MKRVLEAVDSDAEYTAQTTAYRQEFAAGYITSITQRLFPYIINYPGCIQIFADGMGAVGKGSLGEDLRDFYTAAVLEFIAKNDLSPSEQVELKKLRVFSTGIFYRAITLWAVHNNFHLDLASARQGLSNKFASLKIAYEVDDKDEDYIVVSDTHKTHKYSVSRDLYNNPAIGKNISYIGGLDFVAARLDEMIISLTCQHPFVFLDSRDNYARKLPTQKFIVQQKLQAVLYYVYLHAQVPIIQERALQRLESKKGRQLTEEEIAQESQSVVVRNEADFTRQTGRLLRPDEAESSAIYDQIIDTSDCSRAEVLLLFLTCFSMKFFKDNAAQVILNQVLLYFQERENWILEILQHPTYKTSKSSNFRQ